MKRDTYGGVFTSLCANLKPFFRKLTTDYFHKKPWGIDKLIRKKNLFTKMFLILHYMQRNYTMGKIDINRSKKALMEHKHTVKGIRRTSKSRYYNRIEMVYQYLTAKF